MDPEHGVSDLDVVARYAEIEISTVAAQFASTTVNGAKAPSAVIAKVAEAAADSSGEDSDDDSDDDDEEMKPAVESSDDDDSSSDEDESAKDRHGKLRAQIEAAMEKEENRPELLKTENEIVEVPVREPSVKELTPDCPITLCGAIMNVNAAGLMITIKSHPGGQPLDEGSVLCLKNRIVLGAVDEVFGPVQMPLYLVRFQSADKIPNKAKNGAKIYYATEHTTYIVPEQIQDKGTDASNLYDEETDEVVYSDDEAEAAAKRQAKRKRNRGMPVEAATPQPDRHNHPRPGNFTDYHAPYPEREFGGRRDRGGRGGRGDRDGRGDRGGRGRGFGRGFDREGRGRGGFFPPPFGPPNGFAPGFGPPPHGFMPPFPGQGPPFDPRMMHPMGPPHFAPGFGPAPPLPPGHPGHFFPHPPSGYLPPPHFAPPYPPHDGPLPRGQPGHQQQPPLPPLPPTDP